MRGGDVSRLILHHIAPGILCGWRRPYVLGLCGAQGSGKSTVAELVRRQLVRQGRRVAVVSIDDFYLGRDERANLARTVHPLLAVRGVPGTHHMGLWEPLISVAESGGDIRIPRFDKATDDPRPREQWEGVTGPLDVLILEGWFVGAHAQSSDMLIAPVNDLEREEDRDGRWRTWVNRQLAERYQNCFDRLDSLVLLAAPSFDVVRAWRTEQEHALRQATGAGMDDEAVAAFILHYQRLTEHVLRIMPAYADLTITLDGKRRPLAMRREARDLTGGLGLIARGSV